jgi:hypothetical protein
MSCRMSDKISKSHKKKKKLCLKISDKISKS